MSLESDVERLETALLLFSQTIKRPQRWVAITEQAGVSLDRSAAAILYKLMLSQHHGFRVQELAVHLGIEAPSVTRKTQELEADGYLQRQTDSRDKRAVTLSITPKGRTLAHRLWKAQRQGIQVAIATWSASDRDQFVTLFQKFSADLANQPASSTPKH